MNMQPMKGAPLRARSGLTMTAQGQKNDEYVCDYYH
jgi:hypothetical protein